MSEVTNFDDIRARSLTLNGDNSNAGTVETIRMSLAGAETTGTGKATAYLPKGGKIIGVKGYLGTPPVGATLFTIDVNIAGTTIFTTQAHRPIWPASSHLSSATLPDVTTVPDDSVITVDIDAIGNSTAGSDLFVSILLLHQFQS